MKVAQIKKSWIVYPPNYEPGDEYFKIPFLKDARIKALSLGVGADVWSVHRIEKRGSSSYQIGKVKYVVK